MKTLEDLDIIDNTVIIFTSDNGVPGNQKNASNAPLSGFKASALEGGNRVPMIVSWKGTLPEGKISAEIVSVSDLLPTIAYITDIALPVDRIIDGKE